MSSDVLKYEIVLRNSKIQLTKEENQKKNTVNKAIIKKITVMRFLSFSIKKKTPAKTFELGVSSVRLDPLARETRHYLPFFFSRKFMYVRAFLFRVLIWAVGATILIFFVQRAVAHLATSSPCEIKPPCCQITFRKRNGDFFKSHCLLNLVQSCSINFGPLCITYTCSRRRIFKLGSF
jgi:hypothetical protein